MPVRVGLKTIELWNSCLEDAVVEYEKEQQEKDTGDRRGDDRKMLHRSTLRRYQCKFDR